MFFINWQGNLPKPGNSESHFEGIGITDWSNLGQAIRNLRYTHASSVILTSSIVCTNHEPY
jgi:hypothetical protein